MLNLLKPKWLLFVNTIPIGILFLIFYGEYNIIKSLLSPENIGLWMKFGITLAILAVGNLSYTTFLLLKKKEIPIYYGFVALFTYVPFLYLYGSFSSEIIPLNVPRWMIPDNLFIYVGTFLMPTLIHALFILVIKFTSENKSHRAWVNFLIAGIVPAAWYFFLQVIVPLRFSIGFSRRVLIHSLIIFLIIGTVLFLFFLVRTVYILIMKRSVIWLKYQLVWKVPLTIVFPLLGLAINNGYIGFDFGTKFFGDFSNPWFYLLALIGGILLCLPNYPIRSYRVFLFAGRSLIFSYTFYFFLVFIPYLPLSVLAIIFLGTGFLMLTPLVLIVIHANELSADFEFLKDRFPRKAIIAVAITAFLVLPVFVTATYLHDRMVLRQALDYLYTPDYSKSYEIDKESLSTTLAALKQHKKNSRGPVGNQAPYLSAYFNWLVLDNMTLSDSKIDTIEKVFYGEIPPDKTLREGRRAPLPLRSSKEVDISNAEVRSYFDEEQKSWTSWIDLELTNRSGRTGFTEYATTIELPVGCWISDYYLYVGEKKEMGILSEKKSAAWVFSQIRNENRDPGILYYLTGNRVAFRVFPFSGNETRKTGIEFIHKEPVKIDMDGQKIELGDKGNQYGVDYSPGSNDNVVYVAAVEKSKLPKIQRAPYYHFIVDVSSGEEKNKERFINRIQSLLDKNLIKGSNARISFSNTYSTMVAFENDWKENLKEQINEGGFYLERAIKKVLFDSYTNQSKNYPVIVVVANSLKNAVIEEDFADFSMAYPEDEMFYELGEEGNLIPHSFSNNPRNPVLDASFLEFNNKKVLAWPDEQNPLAYLPIDNKPSIVLKDALLRGPETKRSEKEWRSALIMQGKWFSQILHPETSDREWLNLVEDSFVSRIMTPATSYLVVENEAQKAILMKKQKQVLSGNKSLDLGEDDLRMSEPSLMILLVFLGLFILLKRFRLRVIRGHIHNEYFTSG